MFKVDYDDKNSCFFFIGGHEHLYTYKTTYSSIWNPDRKRWEFPFFVGIDKLSMPFTEKAREAINKFSVFLMNYKKYNIVDYSYKLTPFEHQRDTTSFIINRKIGAILSDTGTGKTKCVIDAINYLYSDKDKFLIVVPNSLKYKWKEEFAVNSDLPVYVMDKFDPEELEKQNIIICNYEVFRNQEKVNVFKQFRYKMMVLDESTRIKHLNTKQAIGIYSLIDNCEKRFILTGTLITQSMLDVYGQIKFLSNNIFGNSFKQFREHYFDKVELTVRTKKRGILRIPQWIPKGRTPDYLKKAVNFISIRYRKEDCLDLPPKIYEYFEIPMTAEQEEYYSAVEKDIIDKRITDTTNLLKKLLKLCQISSGFLSTDDGNIKIFKSNKYNELVSILEELDPPVIIWHRFRIEGKRIKELLGDRSVQIVKEMSPEERFNFINKGLEYKNHIIIPIHLGKFGLDLQKATYSIYFSNDFSVEARIQSEDRIYRLGTTKATYIDLLTKKSIDVSIWKFLKKHIDFNRNFLNYNLKNLIRGEV